MAVGVVEVVEVVDGGDKRKGTQIYDARLVVGCRLDISHGRLGRERRREAEQINLQYHLHTPVLVVLRLAAPDIVTRSP